MAILLLYFTPYENCGFSSNKTNILLPIASGERTFLSIGLFSRPQWNNLKSLWSMLCATRAKNSNQYELRCPLMHTMIQKGYLLTHPFVNIKAYSTHKLMCHPYYICANNLYTLGVILSATLWSWIWLMLTFWLQNLVNIWAIMIVLWILFKHQIFVCRPRPTSFN